MVELNMDTTVIVPTYNEAENIPELVSRIRTAVGAIDILVMDDSPNPDTAEAAHRAGCRVIERTGPRGLSAAVIDGINHTDAAKIIVMDADLQHPPEVLPNILEALSYNDIVVASRHIKGGGIEGWTPKRKLVSFIANLLALPIAPKIKDRTSGYFGFCRDTLERATNLNGTGFKIMLEVLIRGEVDRVTEIPIIFTDRKHGESKFTFKQIKDYLLQLLSLYLYKTGKLIKFGVAELLGTLVVFALVWIITELGGLWYMLSLLLASAVGFFIKFGLNSVWTFAAKRSPDDADYDWSSFYKGTPIQKWWKHSIAKTVWRWIPPTARVLDVGCGSSPIISYYPKAVGIDTNECKLSFIRNKLPNTFMNMTATGLEFPDGSFDDVICIELLEHLDNPEEAIAELARVANHKIVIATPDYSKKLWLLAERFTPTKEQHIHRFTKNSLEEMCSKYGLRPLRYKYVAACDLVELFEKV